MKKIAILATAILMIMTAVAFAGCGSSEPKTLEDYLADNEEARQEVESAVKEQSGDDMSVDVQYKGNNVMITSTLKTTYDADTLEAVSEAFDGMGEELDNTVRESIAQIEEKTGITGVTMDMIVKNGDGKEIWNKHFTNE